LLLYFFIRAQHGESGEGAASPKFFSDITSEMKYPFTNIEQHWQQYWEEQKTFRTSEDFSKPKYYVLDMYPYPSGAGLHVGHPEGYTATDIIARYKRMNGFNVLHPMGWDAFGLPAEQYAVKTGVHPSITTRKNIETFRRQLKMIGSRTIGTARSIRPIRSITNGRNGFSANSINRDSHTSPK